MYSMVLMFNYQKNYIEIKKCNNQFPKNSKNPEFIISKKKNFFFSLQKDNTKGIYDWDTMDGWMDNTKGIYDWDTMDTMYSLFHDTFNFVTKV